MAVTLTGNEQERTGMNRLSNLPPGVTDSMIEEQAGWERFEVIESKVWINQKTGQKVSPFGACPWQHPSQEQDWQLTSQGWTIRDNHFNTVGCGRPPWKTYDEAQDMADKWNRRYSRDD